MAVLLPLSTDSFLRPTCEIIIIMPSKIQEWFHLACHFFAILQTLVPFPPFQCPQRLDSVKGESAPTFFFFYGPLVIAVN